MARPSTVQQVATLLGEHMLEPGHRDRGIHCRCGWVTERTENRGGGYGLLRVHQAEVLDRAGLLWRGPEGEGG